jgi:hypothetical protein
LTKRTAYAVFIAVRRMLKFTAASGQLFLGELSDSGVIAMTRITEVRRAPTEPRGNIAAKLTLPRDKFVLMQRTFGALSSARTRRAHEFFRVIILGALLCITRPLAAKVRLLAFEAQIITEALHRIRQWLFIKWATDVLLDFLRSF